MSTNPFFSMHVHGAVHHASVAAEALVLDIGRAEGPDILIFTGDRELSVKLAAAINATLAAHRAPSSVQEAAE